MTNKWPDPSKFASKDEFFKAYTELYGKAKAFQEIIDMVNNAPQKITDLAKNVEAVKAGPKGYGL